MLNAVDTIFKGQGIQHWKWQQDGARPHSVADTPIGRATRALIQAKATIVEPWPAYSPDLSPIEKAWYACEQHLWACESWHDLHTFRRALHRSWAAVITPVYCQKLFAGVRSTYDACVAAGGREVRGWGAGAKPK